MPRTNCRKCGSFRFELDHGCIRHSCFKFALGQWDPSECSDCIRTFTLADDPNSPDQTGARKRICLFILRMIDSRSGRNITRPLFASLLIHSQWCRTWFGMDGTPNCFSKLVYRITELLSLTVEPKAFIHLKLPNPSFEILEPLTANFSETLSAKKSSLLSFKLMSASTSVRTTNFIDENSTEDPKAILMTLSDRGFLQSSITLPVLESDSKPKLEFYPETSTTRIQSSTEVVSARENLVKKEAPEVAEEARETPALAYSIPVSKSAAVKNEVGDNVAESSKRGSTKSPSEESVFNTGLQLSLVEGNKIQPFFIIERSSKTTSPTKGTSLEEADNLFSPSAPLETANTEEVIPVVAENSSTECASLKDPTLAVSENVINACSMAKELEPVHDENVLLPCQPKKHVTTAATGKSSKVPLPAKYVTIPAITNKLATSKASTMNKLTSVDSTPEVFPKTVTVHRNVTMNIPTAVVEIDSNDSDSSSSNFDQNCESTGQIRSSITSKNGITTASLITASQTPKASSDAGNVNFSNPFGCTPLTSISTSMRRALSYASTSSFYIVPESCVIGYDSFTIPGLHKKFSHDRVFVGQLNECRIVFFPFISKRVKRIQLQWEKFDPIWMSSPQPSRSMVISYTSSFFNLLNANGLNLCSSEVDIFSNDSGVFMVENLDEVIKREADASSASSEARYAPRESLSWFTLKARNSEDQSFLKYLQLPIISLRGTPSDAFESTNNPSYVANQKVDARARTRAAEIVKVMQFLSVVETICDEVASPASHQETRSEVLSMLSHVTSFVRKSLASALHLSLEEAVTIHQNLVSESKVQSSEQHTSKQISNDHPTPEMIGFNDLDAEYPPMGEPSRMSAKRKRFSGPGGRYRNEKLSLNVHNGPFQQTDARNIPSFIDHGRTFWEYNRQLYDEQSYSHDPYNWHSKKQRL